MSRPPAAHLSARSKARKQALDLLFQADLMGSDPRQLLREALLDADPPLRDYAVALIQGVLDRGAEVNERLHQALDADWTLDRLARVDRVLARIATWEIITQTVPARVAIAEALVLAGELSTDGSPAFLNGVLSGVARQQPLELDEVTEAHEAELAESPEPETDPSAEE
ncbi:transcription antitermination factor NusB [Tessaracoccus sp. SD287]|uniref:transcription antitermination factor NusB n=1 Tax=Tessaracoccus sp. SD287 TaxID=2782008 RepID=UPI001A959673|nr:transcription antitermination factor NusB [Tessaracoccus sp. SD287]